MAVFTRTTGGLLQLQGRAVTKADLTSIVDFIERTVQDDASRRKLGLGIVKQWAAATPLHRQTPLTDEPEEALQDLQRRAF